MAGGLVSRIALAAPSPAADDIRDIRPPILFPPWWPWLAAAAAALLLLGVVALFIRWWKMRSKHQLTPYEEALRALQAAEALARQGRYREWADLLSRTLRAALAARVGEAVLPQTTSELARAEWTDIPAGVNIDGPELLSLLLTCDLARFAKARMDADSLVLMTGAARLFAERLFAPAPDGPSPDPAPLPSPEQAVAS
jgi:hypothetical protein